MARRWRTRLGAEMPLIYPATGERLGVVHAATPERHRGRAGLRRGRPAGLGGADRGGAWARADPGRAILRERNRELSELETLDTGKPLSETLVADAASGADCLEYFGGMAATLTGERSSWAAISPTRSASPWVSASAIGAWNYPIQIACWKARRRWPAAMRWCSNRLKKRR
jgi:betaine-aldehyde dehydrogenase